MQKLTITGHISEETMKQAEELTAWFNTWNQEHTEGEPLTTEEFLSASLADMIRTIHQREKEYHNE